MSHFIIAIIAMFPPLAFAVMRVWLGPKRAREKVGRAHWRSRVRRASVSARRGILARRV